MNLLALSLGTLAAFMASWALVRAWIDFSQRAKLVDVPNARSSHTHATPRGGGVGIVAAVLIGVAVAVSSGRAGHATDAVWAGALALFVAAISFADDVRSLSPARRLIFHLGAAAAATLQLGAFPALTIPFLEPVVLPAWTGMALTIVWIVGLTNVYNFMDGIDGIAGVQGVVGGVAWAWFGAESGNSLVLWSGCTLAAACAGFLVHNWSPAKVFMGDVGSAFLGFAFAVLPLLALQGRSVPGDGATLRLIGAVPIFAGLVVWPFVADGAFTFVRRALRRENVLKAHRSHLYQRLTIAGWSHASVSRLYLGWAAATSALGATYLIADDGGRAAVAVAAVASIVAMILFTKREEWRATRTRPAISKSPAR